VRLTVENDEVSIARYDSLSGIAEGYGDFQQHLWGVLRVLGKTLRAYHDMGNCHYYPHLGNIGLLRQDGHYHVILRDLCTTVPIDANYLPGQRAGLRFIDLATVLKDLSYNPQHTTFFLLGYFHEMLPNNPEFISMIRECVDSGSFRKGLDLLQQKCNFMELAPANPYFGRIIQNLHTQETNWRSLLESI
jgi:hypothetical protein